MRHVAGCMFFFFRMYVFGSRRMSCRMMWMIVRRLRGRAAVTRRVRVMA
jgi:hypothetical protein